MNLLTQDRLLFPKVLWTKPLNRAQAGRLLVVGGHAQQFSQLQLLYQLAAAAGIGQCHLVMPDSLSKLIEPHPDFHFVPSTPAGSLGRAALGTISSLAPEYDAVILGVDWSQNSETTGLGEALINHLDTRLIVVAEAIDLLGVYLKKVEPERLLIITQMPQLFKLANRWRLALRISGQGALAKANWLQQLERLTEGNYFLAESDALVASRGRVSLTSLKTDHFWLAAALASTFWLQHRTEPFQALTTAAWLYQQTLAKLEPPPSAARTTAALKQILTQYE